VTQPDPLEAALAEMDDSACGECAHVACDRSRLKAALRVAVEVIENAGDSNLHLDDTHWREYILRALRGN
jgi:hypothetical protein